MQIGNGLSQQYNRHERTLEAKASQSACQDVVPVEGTAEGKSAGTVDVESTTKTLPFKNLNFVHSGIGGAAAAVKKNRTWKNLKQILAAEKALPWKITDPNYCSIDAPPSMKPAKKYFDIFQQTTLTLKLNCALHR
ncbi:INO80 complex subunit C-like [Myxocyprinus asiaticus]|uniref:INO80 complex subunit C-like n=1 Tax=Myxocyprinus asiaticus TaxID=70543 RepID=UPI0022235D16|nr:INO80 complex subunit C-like [Myxocyprinus asiaticus]